MRTRLYNAKILKPDLTIEEGEIRIVDDTIEYVGAYSETDISFDVEKDCHGNLLMPGFKNAHTHTAMTFARSLADDHTLDDWLHKAIFPMEAKLTPEHIYWFTLLGYAEYVRGGVTSCFDMYFMPDATSDAAKKAGFRHVFCGSVNDFGGIDRLEDEYKKFNSLDPLISYVIGFHAEYTTSEKIMNTINDISHKYKAPVYAHISETKAEVEGCLERYNMTPAELFDKIGLYDFGGGGFHCVHFTDNDLKIFKDRGLYAVFNACSNLKLGSGIARVDKFIDNGIGIAIGTDGAGSNNALNMFREMYLDTVLSNALRNSAVAVDPGIILKAATSTGARAMGLDDCDSLSEGKKADLIMIDLRAPNMQPVNNTVRNIVYSGNVENVLMTMINGRIVYDDNEFKTIDYDTVIRECNRLVEGMKK